VIAGIKRKRTSLGTRSSNEIRGTDSIFHSFSL
jgi:hypothetical protein